MDDKNPPDQATLVGVPDVVRSRDGDGDDHDRVAEVVGVSKRYGATQALDNVCLTIARGSAHALVGRNGAGKSTLVGVLTGLVSPDSGRVLVAGHHLAADERRAHGQVACVYQRPQLVAHLTVAENLFLGTDRSRIVRWKERSRRAEQILQEWGVSVRPSTVVRELTVEQRQLVEIARALSRGSDLIILDEPTAQLDKAARERLFARLTELRKRNHSFLFISHYLDEVFASCDTVTVLRNGRDVETRPVTDLAPRDLVQLMVGEADAVPAAETARSERPLQPGASHRQPALEIDGITSPDGDFEDVRLRVDRGEIVALTGLSCSGKREVAEAVVGLAPRSGTVRIAGTVLRPRSVRRAIDAGVGYVPEDRHAAGFAPELSIAENLTTAVVGQLGRGGWIRRRRRDRLAGELAAALGIVPDNLRTRAGSLSGGNQQKLVMGRALAGTPSVLVAVAPTAGVDIASKTFLYDRIRRAAARGTGVLLVSDEIDEVSVADRAVVMFGGRVCAEFSQPWSPADVIAAIEGVANHVQNARGSAEGNT